MGPGFLIDTNVIIEFIGGVLPGKGVSWLINEINKGNHCFSPINQIELLVFNGDPDDLAKIQTLIDGSVIMAIDEEIVAQAILIRRQKKIKLPDAVIAATSVVNNLTIVSRNEKDFKGLKGVKVINLHKL